MTDNYDGPTMAQEIIKLRAQVAELQFKNDSQSEYIKQSNKAEFDAAQVVGGEIERLRAQLADAQKERDDYKKAKAENDERFMLERDEARANLAEAQSWEKTAHERWNKIAELQSKLDSAEKVNAELELRISGLSTSGHDLSVWDQTIGCDACHHVDWMDDKLPSVCPKHPLVIKSKEESPDTTPLDKPCYARIENDTRNNCYSRSAEGCEYVGGRCAHCGKSVQTEKVCEPETVPEGFVSCTAKRCGHPIGWHRKSVGACLECGCLAFEDSRQDAGTDSPK